jgi:AraC-like DNA-binding protein
MSPKELTREERQRIDDVKTYVINHLHKQYTIERLSKRAAAGIQKFKDGFYELYGMPAGKYIHEARMKLAKLLLKSSDKSIKEIAALCGYSRARNFSSAYKKFFGLRPGEERN